MSESPRILLVDDGELSEVAMMLERLHIRHSRLRGGAIEDDLAPPSHLLLTTPRRASAVRRGAPPDAPEGRPLRIIVVDEDSNAMRRMLRRLGFQLLVRRGVHPEVWRLLVERALFQGSERRSEARQPIGAPISLMAYRESRTGGGEPGGAEGLLVDISNRGCRLRTRERLAPGSHLSLSIRLDDLGGETLHLRGRLVRTSSAASDDAGHTAGMLFDKDLPEEERRLLALLLNDLSVGPGSVSYTGDGAEDSLPPCESPVVPGLTLDAETDPAFHTSRKVAIDRSTPADAPGAEVIEMERRRSPRGSFTSSVVAVPQSDAPHERTSRVLMGRDLSASGMRIERAPGVEMGDRFTLALYGPAQHEPFLVRARVERDDGPNGFGLRFEEVPTAVVRELEKLVACLPDVESLEDDEVGGLGAVISEVLSRSRDSDPS